LLDRLRSDEPDRAQLLVDFATAAFRRAPAERLAALDPDEGAAMIADSFAFIDARQMGEVGLRVFDPTKPEHGWSAAGTVVECNLEDGPFLLTTVTEELARLGLDSTYAMHPVMGVRRDSDGRVIAVLPARQAATRESWIHLILTEQLDDEARDTVRGRLERVLDDARRATADFAAMQKQVDEVAFQTRASAGSRYRPDEVDESISLLNWLLDDHFILLGYREYDLVESDHGPAAVVHAGSGLGILRDEGDSRWANPVPLSEVEDSLRRRMEGGDLLVVSRTNATSTVHRQVRMVYIGVKKVAGDGRVLGEHRFIGLFAQKAYAQPATTIPILRRKLRQILEREDIVDHSYDERALRVLFDAFPKHELFAADTDTLRRSLVELLEIQRSQDIRLLVRADETGRTISVLVAVPRERFNAAIRLKVQQLLVDRLGASSVDYHLTMTERDQALMHFVLHAAGRPLREVSPEVLESEVSALTRTWKDDLLAELIEVYGPVEGRRLAGRYAARFPAGYAETTSVATALKDIAELEFICAHSTEQFCSMTVRADRERSELLRFVLYQLGGGVELSQFVPVLESLGLTVVEEIPYRLDGTPDDPAQILHIHDFGVRAQHADVDVDHDGPRLSDAAMAIFDGRTAADGLNQLVLGAGLSWQDVVVFRAYRRYRRQVGTTFTQQYIDEALVQHPSAARGLIELFDAKFNPSRSATAAQIQAARQAVLEEFDAVDRLDTDRILRDFLGMIDATLRTNRYVGMADGRPVPYLSLKFDSTAVPDIPKPVPHREIFVSSPEMEGIHLRGGPVARGGLRWSDRLEDYRTEVLGLMKAQMVKNSVIVPTGSKGGFVLRNPPSDPDQLRAEVHRQYQVFIRGLLDLTDNVVVEVDGEHREHRVVTPNGVRRHDHDDPYLVVAADRGTATFSDTANAISEEYGFWLGDAFASGGSRGYDHKAMGITARGAWVAVQRHFLELGVDVQTEPINVVGIGDMSGDVFGNGLLRSDAVRLVAAFDHRDIFIDPDPDPKTSFAERQRLFNLARSSWQDYDRSLISAGGGVWSRTTKNIELSEEMRTLLRVGDSQLAPPDLIRAILRAPTDLLFAGGVGTFIKASDESQHDVGDRANDAIRINATQVGARVVGEGGNLAVTQRGRIQFARRGGRINTDAIDNSAGVDTSDHEVNLKILLSDAITDNVLDAADRDGLLASMADEVAEKVLRDVYLQTWVLSQELGSSAVGLEAYETLMVDLESRTSETDEVPAAVLERDVELLPTTQEMDRRAQAGAGLTRPELAVLLGHSKVDLVARLLRTDAPDEGYLEAVLAEYFPPQLTERFAEQMRGHRLRRELVATVVANDVINRMGMTYVSRTAHELGTRAADVSLAYWIAREVSGADDHWGAIEATDGRMAPELQLELKAEVDRLVDAYTRTYLRARIASVAEAVQQDRPAFEQLHSAMLFGTLGSRRLHHTAQLERYLDLGVERELAMRIATLRDLALVPDVAVVARRMDHSVDHVAEVFFELNDGLPLNRLGVRLRSVQPNGHWLRWQHRGLMDDLRDLRRNAAAQALETSPAGLRPEQVVNRYLQERAIPLRRVGAILSLLDEQEDAGIPGIAVAVRALRQVVRGDETVIGR
jgi:glutamate dehydrogenase